MSGIIIVEPPIKDTESVILLKCITVDKGHNCLNQGYGCWQVRQASGRFCMCQVLKACKGVAGLTVAENGGLIQLLPPLLSVLKPMHR